MSYLKSLKDICKDRPIGFVCHGHSLNILEDNVKQFIGSDMCWGSLNNYLIAQNVLDNANLKLEFIVASSKDYRDKDIINEFKGVKIKDIKSHGNTMHSLLVNMIDEGFDNDVYLFGADGHSNNDQAYYKGTSDIHGKSGQFRIGTHVQDTNFLNKHFPKDHKNLRIYNISDVSKYKPFEKITIEECLSQLLCPH